MERSSQAFVGLAKRRMMTETRENTLHRLGHETFDLLIIGGGITGAGIALDAAARGIKTALVEKGDFASGTSSRSTKLIHGGLRYLQNLEFKLVREVGKERSLIHRLAPHLALPERMLLPLTRGGKYGRLDSSFGLWFYDRLAAVPARYRRKMLNKNEALHQEPLLPEKNLLGAGLYTEFRTDDARLTIEILKTARRKGAVCLNYVKLEDFTELNGQVTGGSCTDTLTGQSLTVNASVIVNATGPWVDLVRSLNSEITGKRLHLTKGIHIVVPHEKLPVSQSVYFDVPDGRMVFAIPRLNHTYIGTTDTDFQKHPDEVNLEPEDTEYLIRAVNSVFPDVQLNASTVVSAWAGLRPLIHEPGKSASEISRKDEVFISPAGLISIAGGKLTGYRVMAKKTCDLVTRILRQRTGIRYPACQTHRIPLTEKPFGSAEEVAAFIASLTTRLTGQTDRALETATYLAWNYGRQAEGILQDLPENSDQFELKLILSEARYTITEEWCETLTDFFDRRTARLYFQPDRISSVLDPVASVFSQHFSWSHDMTKKRIAEVEQRMLSSNN